MHEPSCDLFEKGLADPRGVRRVGPIVEWLHEEFDRRIWTRPLDLAAGKSGSRRISIERAVPMELWALRLDFEARTAICS
jgi:hypothetical protein